MNEIAVKYGVPLPETCKNLSNDFDFKLLAWEYDNLCERYEIVVLNPLQDWDFLKGDERFMYYPAPQMHEIAPLLPEHIKSIDPRNNISKFSFESTLTLLQYINVECERKVKCPILHSHYAEAYAQMYLKLKKEGLL